jgi:hypothetical protein
MQSPAPHRSLIALLRGSTRVAGLVLAMFLVGLVSTVACADHDLADAGIGQHQSHMPAPVDSDTGLGGGPSSGHAAGHCCHSGGHHAPALASLVTFLPDVSTVGLALATEPARPSVLDQRELRPPIL